MVAVVAIFVAVLLAFNVTHVQERESVCEHYLCMLGRAKANNKANNEVNI